MNRHYKALELDKINHLLSQLCCCEDSAKLAEELVPETDFEAVKALMEKTADANRLTCRCGTPSLSGLRNCVVSLKRAQVGAVLAMRELLDVCSVLQTSALLKKWRNQVQDMPTCLDGLFFAVAENRDLERSISSAIISSDEMADDASKELLDIRRKIKNCEGKARSVLDKMVKTPAYQKFLQENIVTMRDGRFVVPVKIEYRNEIKGLVHDTSSSGATLFVEPMGVVEANNEIKVLLGKQEQEIERILSELSAGVGDYADAIQTSYEVMVELDLYFAKSRLADKMKASVPFLSRGGKIDLKKARHPLLTGAAIVPIDVHLGTDFDTLVITGPNTGGKTVALKTLGLLTLMAQCGLMLPVADGSTISVFEKILADIGDEQSIEQSLSTFSAHMTNIIRILAEADSDSLVLMDELGAGTDPVEGAALAVSIIEQLRIYGAKVAATTHYAEMKMFALRTDGVENACCEFDVATLRPTYRLLIGVPGRSNAFAISERLGLDVGVIERAKEHVSGEDTRFEDVVAQLQESRKAVEQERAEIQQNRIDAQRSSKAADELRVRLENERDREIDRARAQARMIVEQVKVQAESLLDEFEEIKRSKDSNQFSDMAIKAKQQFKANMRKLQDLADPVTKKNIENYQPPRPIKRGDIVKIADINREGTVVSDPDSQGYVQVQAGIIKTKVRLSELRLVDQKDRRVTVNNQGMSSTRNVTSKATRDVKTEIDLRGMTADEAIMELDRYIDTSVLMGVHSISIIHGKGTGALRAAIQQHLRKQSSVRTFRLGVYGEGESGVTIAELK